MADPINPTTKQAIDDKLGQGTVDKLQGKAKELLGSAKATLGNLTNDDELRAKGTAQESEGVVQSTVGKAKDFEHWLFANQSSLSPSLVKDGLRQVARRDADKALLCGDRENGRRNG